MGVIDEIQKLSCEAMERFEQPDIVYLGIDTHTQLCKEMAPKVRYTPNSNSNQHHSVSTVVTSAGYLTVKIVNHPKEFIQVGDNVILLILRKMGLKW